MSQRHRERSLEDMQDMIQEQKVATREAYGKTLASLGRENKNIVALDADLSKSTKTSEFAKEFPERFFQMGIAEQDMMGTAAGLATCGKIPFASTFAIFATGRAFDQVRNTIASAGLNVKIAASHAGITVGEDGSSHQSIEDIALMRVLPNMTIIVPADHVETGKAVRAAAAMRGPVYIRLGRSPVPTIFDESYDFKIGKAVILRDGEDVTIAATGIMVSKALEAADELKKGGISARVLNIHTIKPIDEESLVRAAKETGAIVTVEEHTVVGGLGSAVCEVLGEKCPVPVERLGLRDRFGQSGKPDELLAEYGLETGDILETARRAIGRKR